MQGVSWGIWWGLGLEVPAPASLPPAIIREQEQAGLLPPGTAATIGGVQVSRRVRRTYRPELAVCAGPRVLAQPGAGTLADLYGAAWAVGLYRGGPQLFQARSGVWQARDGGAALADLAGARHVALAFDQAARPVVAWERDGAVYVRQWSGSQGQYVTRGPFVGRDPVLLADGPLMGATSDSDVQLYHLSGSGVVLRLQRDLYAVPYPVADVGAGAVLDQVVTAGHMVQLIGEISSGERLVLRSAPYPLRAAHLLAVTASLSGQLTDTQVTALHAYTVAVTTSLSGDLTDTQVTALHAYTVAVTASLSGALTDALSAQVVEPLALSGTLSGALLTITVPHSTAEPLALSGTLTGALT